MEGASTSGCCDQSKGLAYGVVMKLVQPFLDKGHTPPYHGELLMKGKCGGTSWPTQLSAYGFQLSRECFRFVLTVPVAVVFLTSRS